jgi:hypothetical protein
VKATGDGNFNRKWIWLCLILAAFLPFLLRLGLDINAVNRQALRKVYRAWTLTPDYQQLKQMSSDLRFERSRKSDVFDDLFLSMLQRDFRVVEDPSVPIVRSYFEKEKNLNGRIEWQKSLEAAPLVFHYEARFTNNALLLGFWIALILVVFSLSIHRGALVTLALMLLWQVRWNPLGIPIYLGQEISLLWGEFQASRMNMELIVSGVAFLSLIVLFAARPLIRRGVALWGDRSLVVFVLLSFLVEPLALFAASVLHGWGPQVSWWKVYLGSLCFRFVAVAFLISLLFRQPDSDEEHGVDANAENLLQAEVTHRRSEYIRAVTQKAPRIEWRGHHWALLLPLVFLLAGGWEWLNAVMIVDAGWSILMLKAFLTGLLLAGLTGSRFVAMFIGLLALAQVAAPSEGHWVAAAVFGFFAEGLWLGWWLSPMKDLHPFMPLHRYRKTFFVSAFIGWALGIFIYTAGAPLVLCWVVVLLGVWSYGQIQEGRTHRVTN